MSEKIKAIICDLDGTLINCDHRLHFVKGDKKDWKSFLHPENLEQDYIHYWCLELVRLFRNDDYQIIFVSGREKSLYNSTKKILDESEIKTFGYKIYMREDGDYRQDCIIKEEIYKEKIEPFYDVLFCIDDRQQVVNMWRKLGLTCLQCAKGDF